jgi:transketolase
MQIDIIGLGRMGANMARLMNGGHQSVVFGWERYVGGSGCVIRMKTFGASAPLKELQRKFGFIPDSIVTAVEEQVTQGR